MRCQILYVSTWNNPLSHRRYSGRFRSQSDLYFDGTPRYPKQLLHYHIILVFEKQAFPKQINLEERTWRLYLAIGIIMGALLYSLTLSPTGFWTTTVPFWRLALGGLLIGFGTRLSGGCTSGHGISGLASLSTTSLYAVMVFMCVGIVTANLIQLLGVVP